MHVFGLTGGMAAGKSTVAGRFRERGLPVVDADVLARRAVEPGSPGLATLVREFGHQILQPDGSLDRQRLAARAFQDAEARRKLNGVVHPRVRELAAQHFADLEARGEPLACYDVPLLIEVGLVDQLRPVVVVSAPESLQLERAKRRGLSEAEARARLDAQLPLEEKVRMADYVIANDADLATLYQRADTVLDRVCHDLGVPADGYPQA